MIFMELKQFQEAYERLKRGRRGEPSWLRILRDGAKDFFLRNGFPASDNDAWRHTDLSAFRELPFTPGEDAALISPGELKVLQDKAGKNFILVMNGKLMREYSTIEPGVEVMGLEEAIREKPELVEPHLGQCGASGAEAFNALNTVFFRSGLFFHVPEDMTVKEPLQVVFLADPAKEHATFFLRNLVVIGEGSKAALAETYLSGNGRGYFSSAVTEVFLGKNAILDHVKIAKENAKVFHFASTRTLLRHASSFSSFTLLTGGRLARNECHAVLDEEGAACALNGLYLSDGDQLLDQQTFVDHRKPAGKSHQFFKGLMAGNSRGVFNGKVVVRQDAQKTDAHQTYKGLLFSDAAQVDAQPQLEILADDVQCSHGVAIGQLEEDAIFYLRSRGIGEKEAGRMLAQGFALEVIERSGVQRYKDELISLIDEKLSEQLGNRKG